MQNFNSFVLYTGFDIDTPDDFGRTCLHAAAAGGWVDGGLCVGLYADIIVITSVCQDMDLAILSSLAASECPN